MQGQVTPPPPEVLAALESILRSPLFTRAERQSRLLRFIVENALIGDPNALRETSIGLEVYDRPADFDPKEDTIVRVEASRLRSRLVEYYDGDGRDALIRVSIPRGGYVPAFAYTRIEQPAAAKLPEAPASPPPPVVRAKPHIRWILAAAGGLMLLTLAAWRYNRSPVAAPDDKDAEARKLLSLAAPLSHYYTPDSLAQARRLLERAAELAPDSAEVQAALAEAYLDSANTNSALRKGLAPKILKAAQRSRDLAPSSPVGYTALIRYHRDLTMDWNAAKLICEQAILHSLKEQPFLGSCATVESLRGNHEVAWTWAERYAEAQPNSAGARRTLGEVYYRAGQLDRAASALRKAAALSPKGRISPWEYLALVAVAKGKPDEGLAELDREAPYEFSKRVDLYAYRGFVAAKAGKRAEAEKMLALVQHEVTANHAAPVYLSWIYLGLGQPGLAIQHLERGVERRDDTAADFLADPATIALRGLPRFQAAARKLGLDQLTGL
ncbi:tetratricopeptide repeat protein [Paludibaculum fermentans]|uniref:Tetratricopeptide repeat protein n=1 Tax=Paludibaculum fermentans TaxID=1473598 RepID=A0A7S7NMN9_PALFE|nr:CDC27 family protein [Paludibaculum fermentans]QOY86457.1 hypothetical protein IRI77_27170 [Paludibaculum fermentans]